ncbi:MAG: class I SAM-dependent methyltransferase [Bacteroidota bacterium]
MPSSNYDNAAWFYDQLSKLVYGKALVNAQLYLLAHILPTSNILIVGGGTGWILEEITNLYPSGLIITYVEVSEKMMSRSKTRLIGNNQVIYINKAIQAAELTDKFDVVITAFLFDNFRGDTLQQVFDAINRRLKTDGIWLNTDFQLTGKWWQNLMLKSMLLFFRVLCNIEASKLPDIDGLFRDYQTVESKSFFGQFIRSAVYRKTKKV